MSIRVAILLLSLTISLFGAGILPGSYTFEGTGVGDPDFAPDGWLVEGLLVWDGGTTPDAFEGSWIFDSLVTAPYGSLGGHQYYWEHFFYAVVNEDGAAMTSFALVEYGSAADLVLLRMSFRELTAAYGYFWIGAGRSHVGELKLTPVPRPVPEAGTLSLLVLGIAAAVGARCLKTAYKRRPAFLKL